MKRILKLFLEAGRYGNAMQASKGADAEEKFKNTFLWREKKEKSCKFIDSTTTEDKVDHIDCWVTNKKMTHLADIFPLPKELESEIDELSPESLAGLGDEDLDKIDVKLLNRLNDEQASALFDKLPDELQSHLIGDWTPISDKNPKTKPEQKATAFPVSVEIKGIKDMPGFIPIEIETVPDQRGNYHPGWIFGKADLIAFAIPESKGSTQIGHFLMVDRRKLAAKIQQFMSSKKVDGYTKKVTTTLNGDRLKAYVRMQGKEKRGVLIYLSVKEVEQYKRGKGIVKIIDNKI